MQTAHAIPLPKILDRYASLSWDIFNPVKVRMAYGTTVWNMFPEDFTAMLRETDVQVFRVDHDRNIVVE